jgi:acyl carrier protein
MTWGADHELGLCPIGESSTQALRECLRLGSTHEVLHSLLVGRRFNDAERRTSTAKIDGPLGASELEEFLRVKLPSYMVPPAYVFVDSLPVSRNGKIDRKALPPLPPVAGRKPYTAWERTVSSLVADVLGQKEIAVDQSFFSLGGNSLHLVKLQQRIQKELGREIRMVEIFRHPSVLQLARYLQASGDDALITRATPRRSEMREEFRSDQRRKRRERRGSHDRPGP